MIPDTSFRCLSAEVSLQFEYFYNNNSALNPHTFSSNIPLLFAWLGGSQVIVVLLYLVKTETQPVSPPVPLSTPEN
jgi:hypothetical protein